MNATTPNDAASIAETDRKALDLAVLEAVARERKRIGQEFHDHLSQLLLGAAFGAKALADRLPAASPEAAAAGDLARLINSAVQQMRDVVLGLNRVESDTSTLRQK